MSNPIRFYSNLLKGTFINRPNRFILECRLGTSTIRAYMPNPGRLQELLFPGSRLYIVRNPPNQNRATGFTVVAVERDGRPVLLHTHDANRITERLIKEGLVPGLEGFSVLKAEVTIGKSRFDFLIEKDSSQAVLEVKTCSLFLFGRDIAMFPDAITARGRRHLIELAHYPRKACRHSCSSWYSRQE